MVRGLVLANAVALGVATEVSLIQQRTYVDVADYEEDYDYNAAGKGKEGKESPTRAPTEAPTQRPTVAPTVAPTVQPTPAPTPAPTEAPTQTTPVWTGWVNSWDQPVDWCAGNGGVMTGIHSKHDNGKEDRLWDFQSAAMLPSTAPVLSDFVNDWDQEFTYGDDSRVFTGMYSVHDNSKEDRRFKFYQSAHGKSASGCYWTGETGWDAEWTMAASTGSAITGMWSRHDNRMEDRIFKLRFCEIIPQPKPAAIAQSDPVWTGWVNSWDQPVDWCAGNGGVMTGIHSKHDNGKEDRLWDFQSSVMLSTTTPVLSDFVNDWDQEFTVEDDSRVFTGMYSVHDNSKEDRRFKFYQSTHAGSATGCYWTGETNWDAEWTLAANAGSAITGMWSRHDNRMEDRIFKIRFCQIV